MVKRMLSGQGRIIFRATEKEPLDFLHRLATKKSWQ